jgi:hypothetical protein
MNFGEEHAAVGDAVHAGFERGEEGEMDFTKGQGVEKHFFSSDTVAGFEFGCRGLQIGKERMEKGDGEEEGNPRHPYCWSS